MALPNDMSRIASALGKIEGSNPTYSGTPREAARNLVRKTYLIESTSVLANGDNAIVANAAPSIYFKNAVRVMGVSCKTRAALVEHAADIQILKLQVVSAVGVIGNTIAVANTNPVVSGGVGNLTQGQNFSLTVDAANARVAAGTWVGIGVAPAASGVAISALSWAIDVEEEGVDAYGV